MGWECNRGDEHNNEMSSIRLATRVQSDPRALTGHRQCSVTLKWAARCAMLCFARLVQPAAGVSSSVWACDRTFQYVIRAVRLASPVVARREQKHILLRRCCSSLQQFNSETRARHAQQCVEAEPFRVSASSNHADAVVSFFLLLK